MSADASAPDDLGTAGPAGASQAHAECPGETWGRLVTGLGEPAWNMALDEALLEAMPRLAVPVLRFYGWTQPAATFGYSQRYGAVETMTALRPLIRRPTGGGMVLHDADWTYTLVFPARHPWHGLRARESYRRVHEWLQGAFNLLGLAPALAPTASPAAPGECFARAERFDLLWAGAKLAGAAQRRNRQGLLIQGSVRPPRSVGSRADWEGAMTEVASRDWGVRWRAFELDPALAARAGELARGKYAQPAHNRSR